MFDFGEVANRRRVETILTGRMNDLCLEELRGQNRFKNRSSCINVVCIIPPGENGWDFDKASPAISRDLSQHGVSIVHNERLEGEILLEVPKIQGSDFVRCAVKHCSELGRGYFQIGMSAQEVCDVEAIDRNRLERRLAEFEAALEEMPQA